MDENKLRSLVKDEASFNNLLSYVNDLKKEAETYRTYLNLLERAIKNDYDSIIITELELDQPGPTIVYVNDGFTRLTGYTREEAIGQTPRMLQGEKTDRATLDRLKKGLIEGKAFFGQAINYKKDGSEYVNQWDIHPLYDEQGEMTHWVSYQHDITKRKQAEASFNENAENFDDLIEFSKRTLLDVAPDGSILAANKSFRALTGYSKDELDNKPLHTFLAETTSDDVLSLISTKTKGKVKTSFHTKKGVDIEVELEANYHKSAQGEIIRLTVHNVSMQKKILQTLEQRLFNLDALIDEKEDFEFTLGIENNHPKLLYVSEGCESVTGHSKQELQNTKAPFSDLFIEDESALLMSLVNQVISGKEVAQEMHLKHASGETFRVLLYLQNESPGTVNGQLRISGSIAKVYE